MKCTKGSAFYNLAAEIRFGVASALFLASLTVGAATPSASPPLPELLKQIEAKYTESGTISADFSQINSNVTLSQKKTSSGKIFVKRPSKIRWETLQPEISFLVSDGIKFWFYTPPFDKEEPGQVIEKKSSEVQSQLANSLLAGIFSTKSMAIKKLSDSTFQLTPKPGTAGTVLKATIEINREKKLIEKITLDHQGGNHTEISLSQIDLGKKLDDSFFVFKAPPNTDKVQ